MLQKLLNTPPGSFALVMALPITNFEAPILIASDASETLDWSLISEPNGRIPGVISSNVSWG